MIITVNNSGTGFDYAASVDHLRDMMSYLEGVEDESNDLWFNTKRMWASVRKVDVPEDMQEDLDTAFGKLEDKLIELHNVANRGAYWIDEVLDQLKSLPMSE